MQLSAYNRYTTPHHTTPQRLAPATQFGEAKDWEGVELPKEGKFLVVLNDTTQNYGVVIHRGRNFEVSDPRVKANRHLLWTKWDNWCLARTNPISETGMTSAFFEEATSTCPGEEALKRSYSPVGTTQLLPRELTQASRKYG